MITLEQINEIALKTSSRIVFLVIDGLGGLPRPETGKTELETAYTPNLDQLAGDGICGLIELVGRGITPGSGPGHLAIFGYDPLRFSIGRGVLEALGIDLELDEGDVAARGNFCTIDDSGLITDRRAGRITTERNAELSSLLNTISIENARLLVTPVREHRFVVVFRGEGLSDNLTDTDPQKEGVAPKPALALSPQAERTAKIANRFADRARELLRGHHPANMILLRGFSRYPNLPTMSEVYKLRPAAIATYPMYRGIARLLGMENLKTGSSIEDEFITLKEHFKEYDFFFLHIKQTDSAGEDGDFEKKARIIEEVDALIPHLRGLDPDVIVVTGDHSTPAVLKGHSWHPVPFLLYSRWCRPDGVREFSERACLSGSLGTFPGVEVMPLAMANALKLNKFGA